MPNVIKVKAIKEETHVIQELRDIEELVINTMGEDIWVLLMGLTQDKIDELEEEIKALKDDEISGDGTVYSLRSGIQDGLAGMEKLLSEIEGAQRLDRRRILKSLKSIIKGLENCED